MRFVCFGAGEHARVIMEVVESIRQDKCVGCVTDPSGSKGTQVSGSKGTQVIGTDDDLARLRGDLEIEAGIVALASTGSLRLREKLYRLLLREGLFGYTLIHPTASIAPSSVIGPGCCVMAMVVVNTAAFVGENSILNTGSVVEHDCWVGAHTHIAPGAVICGGVITGERVHIGAGATILPHVEIGADVTVAAGAVVTENLPAGVTAVGVPARYNTQS